MSKDKSPDSADTSLLMKYNSRYKEILHTLISEQMKGKTGFSVLDIGCRWGTDLQKIASINTDAGITGIDISGDALTAARMSLKENRNVSLLKARGEDLPFRDNSFDLIISSEVIEHIKDVERFIRSVRRVLKNQGVVIITTPSRFNYVTLVGKVVPRKFKNMLRRYVYYLPQSETDVDPHEYEYTPEEMKNMFEKNGFKVDKILGGVLRVPVWPLFDRIKALVLIWQCLDRIVEKIPLGINLKHNIVLESKKLA